MYIVKNVYSKIVLGAPVVTVLLLCFILVFFTYHGRYFQLDASVDSLLLEGDQDLRLFRQVASRYQTQDFLLVTFTPDRGLFSPHSLELIRRLRDELAQLEHVDSVISLIDVPLVKQVDGTLSNVADNVRKIEDGNIDIDRARQELLASPVYRDLIISADGKTTAIQINLKRDIEFDALQVQRSQLHEQRRQQQLSIAEQQRLARIEQDYAEKKNGLNEINSINIMRIRAILARYRDAGQLYLGGVPMIIDDMITFIQNDLFVFGVGVFLFLLLMLSVLFRQWRWVLLPLTSCVFVGLFMIGLLGLIGWQVTVVSSNFISLILIITMSMNIHLVIRYRQLRNDFPQMSQRELVLTMAAKMARPCLYTALTSIIAFVSLILSEIKPVIDFGWMMTVGLSAVFLGTFLLFPAVLVLLPRSRQIAQREVALRFTGGLATLAERRGGVILISSILLLIVSLIGIAQLEVENSFINYFSDDTEIYQGLKHIDEKLGGTTPLDIVLKLGEEHNNAIEMDEDMALFGSFEDEAEGTWLTPDRLHTIKAVHDYLDRMPAVGKVLSLASVIRVGEDLNGGEFDALALAIIDRRMPASLKEAMFDPYVSIANDEARINVRILDSLKDLRRKELIEDIRAGLINELGLAPEQFQISGALVLYNNMLQSLFQSQIQTLGIVMVGIALMLLLLFRSIILAVIGIVPNLLTAMIILGLMGLLQIPLDMMTITIAAITIGIAVDNSIHYIYRFREEYPKFNDYIATLYYCHANIGNAVFYTAITIIVGFSILVLSNFIPTIYFGLLTALAMFIALLAALTLLPVLILLCRPFK